MSFLSIPNVIIGLVFLWLVFSLASMYIQEWLAARSRWRARMLETTIRNMLSDPGLADQLYNHPLIRGLYSGKDGTRKPAYIPSGQFALALVDIVASAGTEAALLQNQLYRLRWDLEKLGRRKRKAAKKRLNLILALIRRALVAQVGDGGGEESLAAAMVEVQQLALDYPKLKPDVELVLENVRARKERIAALLSPLQPMDPDNLTAAQIDQLRAGVTALAVTHPRLKQTMQALLTGTGQSGWDSETAMVQVRQNIEAWFNSGMDRLSGWYKRRAQTLAFTIGTLLAFCANADSVNIATRLWREPVLREQIVQQAEAYAGVYGSQEIVTGDLNPLRDQAIALNLPLGWIGEPILHEWVVAAGIVPVCSLFPVNSTDFYGVPVFDRCLPLVNTPQMDDWTGWGFKIIGLLITSLATAQGAPFWFDVLKKIINIRSSGASPVDLARNVG